VTYRLLSILDCHLDRSSQILSVCPADACQPIQILNAESQKSVTAEKIHPQELGKKLRVPMIRWGEMCAGENTQAGKIMDGASQ
jgi:hypothetical protein